jgi:hypothetical protein
MLYSGKLTVRTKHAGSHQNLLNADLLLHTTNDDVVDGDKDEFNRVPNEPHDGEPDGATVGNLFELLRVGLSAPLNQSS